MRKRTHALTVLALMLLTSAANANAQQNANAGNSGLERTPLLGWSSWSFLRKGPTAANIEAQALALHNSGLQQIGYTFLNMDDFWYQCPGSQGPNVDRYGRWVTDSSKFPSQGNVDGIKILADYLHGLGLKFGIYVTPGISMQAVSRNTPIEGTPYTAAQIAKPSVAEANYNCRGMVAIDYRLPGAQEYTNSWVTMFAAWGVDYIKIDGMKDTSAADVEAWSKAIRHSGRAIILDVTEGNFTTALAPTLMKYADQWEFAPDIECSKCEKAAAGGSYPLTSWPDIVRRFDLVAAWQPYAGSGRFNDYDSIEIGNGSNDGLTPVERQTHLSLWALASAPLILGVDLTHLDRQDLQKYLQNTAVLAVDQDSIAAKRIANNSDQQVFAKLEANGDAIVGLFNTGEKAETVSVQASAVGLPKSAPGYSTHDLWTGEVKKTGATITAIVPSHGVALYRVTAH